MPRVTFSNELNDFVKGFAAGSAIVDAKEDRDLKREKNAIDREEVAAKAKYYDAYAKHFGGGADETAPFISDGVKRFGGEGAPSAVPVADATPPKNAPKPPAFLNAINDKYSLPAGHLSNTAFIESRYNPNAHAKGSSAAGMFQFTNGTAEQYGLTNRYDAMQSAEAAARKAVDDRKTLVKVLGREPTGAELYFAHQQGGPGAAHVFKNPDMSAVALLGRDAVLNNGGTSGMTGRDFFNMWQRKYEAAKGKHAALDLGADEPVQMAARGGMIRAYEDGGAVPAQEPAEKPYYATDLMDDVGAALGKLGEVVHAGLTGLQEKFGLNSQPAVAQADPDYKARVTALTQNDGMPPAEQVEALRSKVDPENQLGVALGTTYGMVKAYEHYLAKGDVKSAQATAASIMQYTKAQSQRLGALAVHALQAGDETSAAKALAQAYNVMPNGKEATVDGKKVTITDQRTGKVIEQREFTPDMLMNAAMGMTNGSAYLNDLSSFATSEKERIAQGHDETKLAVAGQNNDTKTNIANMRINSAEKLKRLVIDANSDENDKKIAAQERLKQMGIDNSVVLKQMGIDATKATTEQKIEAAFKLRQLMIDAHSDDTEKKIAARVQLKQMDIDADAALQDDKQQGAVDLEGVKQSGRSALETQKQGGRTDLETQRQGGRSALQTQKAGDAVALEGVKQGGRTDLETQRQGGRSALETQKQGGRETLVDKNNTAKGERQAVDLGFKGEQKEADRGLKISEGQANRDVRVGTAAENRALKESEGEKTRKAAMDRTVLRTDTSTANNNSRITAAGERQDKGIAAAKDKAQTGATTGRQSKELDRIGKMTDHAILGADEAVTPKVSAGQATATRNIARSILEAGGDKYGDSAVAIARSLTAFDPATRRLKANFRLSEGKDGYSVSLPNGATVPISAPGYAALRDIQSRAGAQ